MGEVQQRMKAVKSFGHAPEPNLATVSIKDVLIRLRDTHIKLTIVWDFNLLCHGTTVCV
jgi:hypothetical protein